MVSDINIMNISTAVAVSTYRYSNSYEVVRTRLEYRVSSTQSTEYRCYARSAAAIRIPWYQISSSRTYQQAPVSFLYVCRIKLHAVFYQYNG